MPAIADERGLKELAHGLSLRERITPNRPMSMVRIAKKMTITLRMMMDFGIFLLMMLNGWYGVCWIGINSSSDSP